MVHFTNHNGLMLDNVKITYLLWGHAWRLSPLGGQYPYGNLVPPYNASPPPYWGTDIWQICHQINTSTHLSALNEYRATGFRVAHEQVMYYADGVIPTGVTPDPSIPYNTMPNRECPQTFTTSDVINYIYSVIQATSTAPIYQGHSFDFRNDPQHLYFVFIPPWTGNDIGSWPANSGPVFDQFNTTGATGAHGSDTRDGLTLHYGFTMTRTPGNPNWFGETASGTQDMLTETYSHELVESCTDPEGTGMVGDPGSCSAGTIGSCEICDVCENTNFEAASGPPGGAVNSYGIKLQGYWLNSTNGCFPGPVTIGFQNAPKAMPAWGENGYWGA